VRFLDAVRATALGILADKGPVVPAILGMVVYCFFYPLPYLPQTVRDVPVAVVDQDASELSRSLVRNLDATRDVRVIGVTRTVEEALPLMYSGRIGGLVTIPGNFRRDVLSGNSTGITVMGNGGLIVLDGSLLATAAEVTAATVGPDLAGNLAREGVPAAAIARAARANPLFVKQPLFNVVQGYESYVVAASMGLIVMQLLTVAIAMAVATWCEKGAWPVATGRRIGPTAFAGMVTGFALFVLMGLLFWIGFVFWYHDLPRAANLGGAIAFASLYSVTVAAFAISLGAWMAERERVLQFIAAVSVPLLFMSGFAFPVESLSAPIHLLSLAFPTTPGIQGFIALNQMGARLGEIEPQILHLSLLCAAFLATAWFASSRRTSVTHSAKQHSSSIQPDGRP
jgi:ABC-2 type transport system permease protein